MVNFESLCIYIYSQYNIEAGARESTRQSTCAAEAVDGAHLLV